MSPIHLNHPVLGFLILNSVASTNNSFLDFWVSVGLLKLLLFWTGSNSRSRKEEEEEEKNPKQPNVFKANLSSNEFFPSKTVAFPRNLAIPEREAACRQWPDYLSIFSPQCPFKKRCRLAPFALKRPERTHSPRRQRLASKEDLSLRLTASFSSDV